jgi:hypothetical protein
MKKKGTSTENAADSGQPGLWKVIVAAIVGVGGAIWALLASPAGGTLAASIPFVRDWYNSTYRQCVLEFKIPLEFVTVTKNPNSIFTISVEMNVTNKGVQDQIITGSKGGYLLEQDAPKAGRIPFEPTDIKFTAENVTSGTLSVPKEKVVKAVCEITSGLPKDFPKGEQPKPELKYVAFIELGGCQEFSFRFPFAVGEHDFEEQKTPAPKKDKKNTDNKNTAPTSITHQYTCYEAPTVTKK